MICMACEEGRESGHVLVELPHTELDRMRRWIDDLQSGMYVNCVYCGHRYGPGETTPVTMADALKAHVEQCPSHPMSALKAREARLREALVSAAVDAHFVHRLDAKSFNECMARQCVERRAALAEATG